MKKIFAILAMVAATSAMADSATVEYQNVNNIGAVDQKTGVVVVRHDFNSTFTGDVQFSNTQTNESNALSTRLEAGLTATQPLVGSVSGYVRAAGGQKFTNTVASGYYSVEPGVSMPVTGALSAKVGIRLRQATSDTVNDTTHTVRAGVSYALNKNDAVGLRFDRVRGDNTQNITALNYTRSF